MGGAMRLEMKLAMWLFGAASVALFSGVMIRVIRVVMSPIMTMAMERDKFLSFGIVMVAVGCGIAMTMLVVDIVRRIGMVIRGR
jgi:hypothetical protein